MANKKFEYKIIRTTVTLIIEMNRLGEEGWELVCTDKKDLDEFGSNFYFKREKGGIS